MSKKYFNIIILSIVFSLIGVDGYCQLDKKKPSLKQKNGNFKKKTFTSNAPDKPLGPPGPGDGDGGYPVPIPGGVYFLFVGGVAYFYRRLKNEKESI